MNMVAAKIEKTHPGTKIVVYMDDFAIGGEKREVVFKALRNLKKLLGELGLTVNEEKSSQQPET